MEFMLGVFGKILASLLYDGLKKVNNLRGKPTISKNLTNIPENFLSHVIGRQEKLQAINEKLKKTKAVVVYGMGGVGKSTIAQKYIHKYGYKFSHIAYINISLEYDIDSSKKDNKELIISAFTGNTILVKRLGLEFEEKQPPEEKFDLILNAMQYLKGKNLLVIDNAGRALMQMQEKLPPEGWQMLVTSRCRIECFENMEIEFLNEDECTRLFYTYYGVEKNDELLKHILVKIGYHTLATELIAKSANERGIELSELDEIIKKEGINYSKAVSVIVPHAGSDVEELKPIEHLIRTFAVNYLDDESREVMLYLSVLPSKYIEFDILKELLPVEENKLFEILNKLNKTGWLNKSHDAFSCHQVIQSSIRAQQKPDTTNCDSLIKKLTDKLSFDQTKEDVVEKFQWCEYGASVLLFLQIETEETAELANNLALILQDMGELAEARKLMEQALASDIKNLGEGRTSVATDRSNLALILKDMGELAEARKLMDQALASGIKNLGEGHTSVAIRRSNLAMILKKMGEYNKAKELLEKAYKTMERKLGAKHPNTLIVKRNLEGVVKAIEESKKH